jgi:hypothetical protein
MTGRARLAGPLAVVVSALMPIPAPGMKGKGRDAGRPSRIWTTSKVCDFLNGIVCGDDAHEGDPLGGLQLVEDGFASLTWGIAETAHRRCGGRGVSMREGGYVLDALGRSAAVHIRCSPTRLREMPPRPSKIRRTTIKITEQGSGCEPGLGGSQVSP